MSEKEKDIIYFFDTAAQNSPEPLYFVTRERKIIFWNKKAEESTGYSSSEIVGHFCFNNILQHTDENGTYLCKNSCPLVIAMETGMPQFSRVYLKTKEGARIPVSVEVYPVTNSRGKITGAVEYFYEEIGLKAIKQKIIKLERETFIDPLTSIQTAAILKSLSKNFLTNSKKKENDLESFLLTLITLKRLTTLSNILLVTPHYAQSVKPSFQTSRLKM